MARNYILQVAILFISILFNSCSNDDDMKLFQIGLGNVGDTPTPPTEEVVCFIIAGQSNAAGTAKNAPVGQPAIETPEPWTLEEQEDVKIWSGSAWENLWISSGNNISTDNTTHGIEIGIIQYKQIYYPDQTVYIIKKGQGATEIRLHLPEGYVYQDLRDNYLTGAINNLVDQGINPSLKMMWLQGERDSKVSDGYIPDAYFDLLGSWKGMWNLTTGNLPLSAPHILIYDSDDDIINQAFDDFDSAHEYFKAFPTNGYIQASPQHFSHSSFLLIAESMLQWFSTNGLKFEQTENIPYATGQVPSVPTNLVASDIASNSFQLTWSVSTNGLGYTIYIDGTRYYTVGDTLTFNVRSQVSGSTVSVSIDAWDEKNQRSAKSTAINVTLL